MGELHLGVALPNYGEQLSPRTLVDALQVAESQGFDSAWTTDHVAVPEHAAPVYGNITEALVTLGFAIGHTTRLRLGTSALVVPQREPVLALKQLHSLDYLSGGRLITAVAAGWIEEEFDLLGASFADRGRRFDGWLEMVGDVAQQVPGPIDHAGVVDMHRHWMSPAPARPDGLQLWVAGGSSAALRRAAGVGTWHPVAHTPSAVRDGADRLRARRPDAAIVHRIGVSFADTPDEDGRDERGRPGISGPPDWIASRLLEHIEAGCTGFVVTLEVFRPGLAERIDRFAREVWPTVVAEQRTR